jgi:hypothetical protein
MSLFLKILAACAAVFVLFIVVLACSLPYLLSPDGPWGYDEGARMAIYAERFAEQFQKSPDQSAAFLYTPRYGNDQTFTVDLSAGQYCPNHLPAPGCIHTTVTVNVQKGRDGNGYALGNGAAVPRHLRMTKAHGPIQLDFKKVDGVVQVVGLE